MLTDYWENWIVEIDGHDIPGGDEPRKFEIVDCPIFSAEEFESGLEIAPRWATIEFEINENEDLLVVSAPPEFGPVENIGRRIAD